MKPTSISLHYGITDKIISLPAGIKFDTIAPKDAPAARNPIQVVSSALDHPVEGLSLGSFKGARSAAIAINDKTRPVPHEYLLPPLLQRLEALGIPPQRIQLVIASGTHTPMPPAEYALVLPPEIITRYPVSSHDCDSPDLVKLGETPQGTPVEVNRIFYEADLRIVLGNIEPHHFMGFSGGVKSAAIGLGGRKTIIKNHAMLSHPLASTGHYEDNPMRLDVEEIGKIMGVHYAVNAILNNEKRIVSVFAGDPRAVMLAAIPHSRRTCQVEIHQRYDFVIASAGGFPKDINLYQSQKALTHAALTTRNSGFVLLLAACSEGIGSAGYERFMEGLSSHEEVLQKYQSEGFSVGPHKAFQVSRDASRVHIYLHSEIPPRQLEMLLLHPAVDLEKCTNDILRQLPAKPRIAVMPLAPVTIPVLV